MRAKPIAYIGDCRRSSARAQGVRGSVSGYRSQFIRSVYLLSAQLLYCLCIYYLRLCYIHVIEVESEKVSHSEK